MLTFQQFRESLDTPAKVFVGPMMRGEVHADFRIEGGFVYLMDFYKEQKNEQVFFGAPDVKGGDSYWVCDFRPSSETLNTMPRKMSLSQVGSYGVLGSGHQFAVFAGALQAFKAFIAKYRPDCITFTGEEDSRKRLYRRFVLLARKTLPGYAGKEIDSGVFAIYRR